MTHEIRPGQVYVACHPLDEGRRIRVLKVAGDRITVETLGGGPRRYREMGAAHLHASATSPRTGRPRRTGYALETGQ